MCYRILLFAVFFACAGILTAVEPYEKERLAFDEAVGKLVEAYNQSAAKLAESTAEDSEKLQLKTVSQLQRAAESLARKRDLAGATIAWRELLRIQVDHTEAKAFFEALGTLEATLDVVLQNPKGVEKDFTGAVMGEALSWPKNIRDVVLQYQDGSEELVLAFKQDDQVLRDKFSKAETRLRDRYLRSLTNLSGKLERAGKLPEAALSYEEMLFWDRDHTTAVEFFTALGTLETKLAALDPEPTAGYFLGEAGSPKTSGGVYTGLKIDGKTVMIFHLAKNGETHPLTLALVERLEKAGATVVYDSHIKEGELDGIDVMIAIKSFDQTVHSLGWFADGGTVPLLVVHPKNLSRSRLVPGRSQYPHPTGKRSLVIEAADHPVAGRLKGEVVMLNEPEIKKESRDGKKGAKPVAARKGYGHIGPSDVLRTMDRSLTDVGDGILIASIDGLIAAAAWEKGAIVVEAEPNEDGGKPVTASRMVGLFCFSSINHELMTNDAWRLFDASLAWLLASP